MSARTSELLIRSGVPIAAAAADAGFADQAHLTRLFKRSYGHTPGLLVRDHAVTRSSGRATLVARVDDAG